MIMENRNWKKQGVVDTENSPFCDLKSIPINAVDIRPGFWHSRMEASRIAGIPPLLKLLEEHGVVDNFRRLSGKKKVDRKGGNGTDSDLYKWMEAAAFVLQTKECPELKNTLTKLIEEIIRVQEKDGYLNTNYVGEKKKDRFNFSEFETHESYCAGHFIQFAIAYYRATGETEPLECAGRLADYYVNRFLIRKQPMPKTDHPELEMAMVELYRITRRKKYLEFAKYLLDTRGFYLRRNVRGHAVCTLYLFSGATDYYAETGHAATLRQLNSLWQDMVHGKVYITGGVGSHRSGEDRADMSNYEAFGLSYELPNETAYTETCAAIANVFWNWRMLLVQGRSRFADLMEIALYNGFLSGVSLKGKEYFYRNPLAWTLTQTIANFPKDNKRTAWYDCTCCPTNAVRMFSSLPGYFFSANSQGIWVHLYDNCVLRGKTEKGQPFALQMKTKYPWEGGIDIILSSEKSLDTSLFLRIPSWCKKSEILINGKKIKGEVKSGAYFEIQRQWNNRDCVSLRLAMPVVAMASNPLLRENNNRVALQRGPIVYCFESKDNPKGSVLDMSIDIGSFKPKFIPGLLGGIVVLDGKARTPAKDLEELPLYDPVQNSGGLKFKAIKARAIPYHAWANRGKSKMQVWMPYEKLNQ
jgi:uncharacterized protein